MRITILAVGSRGDVQQCVALGHGLQAAGHRVRLATHNAFEPLVREYGLDFALIPGQAFGGMNAGLDQAQGAAASALDQRPHTARFAEAIEQWMVAGLAASQDADALIYGQLCFVGAYVGEKLHIPVVAAYHSPITRTAAFPTIYGRLQRSLGGPVNWLTHVLDQQIFWQSVRSAVNHARRVVLDLPPLPFWGPYGRMQREQQPVLYGYSPLVVAKPADWGAWIEVTGYWLLDQRPDWQPSADLVDFLAAGPPPVYVGLGSVANANPVRVTKHILKALADLKQRVVLMPGQVDLSDADLPAETLIVRSIPHDWLYARVAAVIHHGGPGTLAAAMRAGVPSLAIPFFGDQFFWGRRAYELGVGPRAIRREQVTANKVAAAVRTMLDDQPMRARAHELGRRLRAEDGVARAVEAIERRLVPRFVRESALAAD